MTPIEKALTAMRNAVAADDDQALEQTHIEALRAGIAALEAQAPTDERAMFEAWLENDNPFPQHHRSGYTALDVEGAEKAAAWEGFQAGRALLAAQPEQEKFSTLITNECHEIAALPALPEKITWTQLHRFAEAVWNKRVVQPEQAKPEAKPVEAMPSDIQQKARELSQLFGLFKNSSHLCSDGRPAHLVAKEVFDALAAAQPLQAQEPVPEPYLCIKPACGDECSGCNSAISPDQARIDAVRYRWLRDKCDGLSYTSDTGPRPSTPEARMMYAINAAGKRTTDMIEIRLLCHHLGPHDEPIWRDGEHFDYAANMDAAIDAAITKTRGAA